MRRKARLERLERKRPEPWDIEVWLYDLEGDTATGPGGERMSVEEAGRRQEGAGLVIDLRVGP